MSVNRNVDKFSLGCAYYLDQEVKVIIYTKLTLYLRG